MIDEKMLIEILSKNSIFEKITNAEGKNVFEIIDDLPKIEEKNCGDCSRRKFYQEGYQDGLNADKWISCSERLPTEQEAWYRNDEEGVYEPNEFIVQVKGAELPTVAVFDGKEFTNKYADDGYGFLYEIIAWQPLPEPYKGE